MPLGFPAVRTDAATNSTQAQPKTLKTLLLHGNAPQVASQSPLPPPYRAHPQNEQLPKYTVSATTSSNPRASMESQDWNRKRNTLLSADIANIQKKPRGSKDSTAEAQAYARYASVQTRL